MPTNVTYKAGAKQTGTVKPTAAMDKARSANKINFMQFPTDLGVHQFVMNFVKFKMGGVQDAPNTNVVASLALPLPGAGITDKSGVKYNQDELGIVGGSLTGAVSGAVDAFGGDAEKPTSMDGLKALVEGGSAAGRTLANQFGQGVGAAADQIFGNVVNPHIVLLFKNVDLKTFTLTWKLSPASEQESRILRAMITKLNQLSHPEQKSEGNSANFFLNYPHQCDLFYLGVNENLHYFKRCAITAMEVNYQGEGQNLLFADSGAPVRVDLSLTFQETEIWTAEDYEYGDQIERGV
jgi:hypothetical protein